MGRGGKKGEKGKTIFCIVKYRFGKKGEGKKQVF